MFFFCFFFVCFLFVLFWFFQFHDSLVGKDGLLIQLINDTISDLDTLKEAVQCLECLTIKWVKIVLFTNLLIA